MQQRAEVKLYGTRTCGWCLMAERLLRGKGVVFQHEDVSGNHARRRWLRERTGRSTVPQVFINDQPVGGYTDLAALESAGRLDALLAWGPAVAQLDDDPVR
jgi:glutaredoxin 3